MEQLIASHLGNCEFDRVVLGTAAPSPPRAATPSSVSFPKLPKRVVACSYGLYRHPLGSEMSTEQGRT
jgi:hypothetical protein